MTEYLGFQYSDLSGGFFTFQPAHRVRETVQLLTWETPDFIAPALWLANSPGLNPVDYQIKGSCRSVYVAAGFMTLTSWSHAWSKSGNISTRYSSMKRPGSGVHVFQLAFEHTEDILNTDFSYVWYLYRRTLWQSHVCAVAYSGHFCFGGDLTKPSITIASVDRFYWSLVICLQLEIALSVQNSVKIWHCLSELWQCMHGVTFFVDTV